MKSNEDDTDDQIVSHLGIIGPWQWRIISIVAIFCIPPSCHIFVMTFMNAKIGRWCARPEHLKSISVDVWRNISGQHDDECSIFNEDWDNVDVYSLDNINGTEMIPCNSWEYDTSVFLSTITSDFNLVCDREYLISLAQTFFFFGIVVGVFALGILSDMFGRKKVLVPLLIALGVTGIASSQMPNYVTFVIARVINASVTIGIFQIYLTYLLEFVGGKYITIIGIGVEYIWVLGLLFLSGLAYLIRDWRLLVLSYSVPSLASLLMFWLLPESPRWLLTVGKIQEAERIVKEGAKYNKIKLPDNFQLDPIKSKTESSKKTFLDLYKSPNMRAKTLILNMNWFVNTFAYYGLSLNMSSLTGGSDIFLNFSMASVIELPAYAAATFLVVYFGRRVPYSLSLISYGISLIIIIMVPRGIFPYDWPVIVLSLVSKMSITFSFGVIFLFTAELFPTEVRTSGIGSANFIGRFGGMVAPWIELAGKHYHPHIPPIVFGASALVAGGLALLLPETRGKELPDTIEQAEKLELSLPAFLRK